MKRRHAMRRDRWQAIVESQGLHFHTLPELPSEGRGESPAESFSGFDSGKATPSAGVPYWDESAYYEFTSRQIEAIETCTYWLNDACLKACEFIIEQNLFACVGIPESHIAWIKRSWERDEHTIYGRFDLWYNGSDSPKLLEYNADTPTALLEAAVIQWYWLKDCHPQLDQFNTIHERLLEIFRTLKQTKEGIFHFAAMANSLEDFMTVSYLRDVAMQSGWKTEYLPIGSLGWNARTRQFTDPAERPIRNIFKLYPWEWMVHEPFGEHLLLDTTDWFEPPWKMMLSNKGLLPILYQLFPESPHLFPATFGPMDDNYVKKPLHGREGANVEMVLDGQIVAQTEGPYPGPFVYQQARLLPCFEGFYPVLGSWMVNGYASGLGIREDNQPITSNTSRFVPHVIG